MRIVLKLKQCRWQKSSLVYEQKHIKHTTAVLGGGGGGGERGEGLEGNRREISAADIVSFLDTARWN